MGTIGHQFYILGDGANAKTIAETGAKAVNGTDLRAEGDGWMFNFDQNGQKGSMLVRVAKDQAMVITLIGEGPEVLNTAKSVEFKSEDRQMDEALAALYEADSRHSLRGGSGASSPRVARWLGDIRRFFPSSVVQVMQKDAFDRLNLHSMLLQPEMLESVQPDVNLVSTLMSLRGIIPEKTKETARLVVRKVVDALMKQLEEPMRTAVSGALNRAVRNRRPRHAEIDWNRTIRANLKHWQQEYKTIVPETLIGYGRKSQRVQREIILCIDQSGSMASSVVYSSIFGAVMASMPAAIY